MADSPRHKNIKLLQPDPRKRYKQGYYDSFYPKKYLGPRPIIYRSSLELRFMNWCELSPAVVTWGSEPFSIPYYGPTGKYHLYYPDFILMMSNGSKLLVEVKPKKDIPQNDFQIKTDPVKAKNAFKWKAATEWCKQQKSPTRFVIVTEDFFTQQKLVK